MFNNLLSKCLNLLKPAQECYEIGHNKRIKVRRIRRKGKRSHSVCEDFYVHIEVCSRCGKEFKVVKEEHVKSWTQMTMSMRMWKTLDEDGFVVLNEEI